MYRVVEATSEEEGWKSSSLIHLGPEVARGHVQGGGGHYSEEEGRKSSSLIHIGPEVAVMRSCTGWWRPLVRRRAGRVLHLYI